MLIMNSQENPQFTKLKIRKTKYGHELVTKETEITDYELYVEQIKEMVKEVK